MQYRVVALLPMKANSERIPGKNFKQFHGKPLFSWILSTLLELEEIDQVVINTNAREVLELYPYTNENRVQIRDRHSTICGDYISMNRIIADDLNSVDSEIYVMTHVTNPLLGADTILSALLEFQKAYSEETADSLFSVNKHLTRFYKADGSAINHDPSGASSNPSFGTVV